MTKLEYSGGEGTEASPYTNNGDASVYTGPAYYAYVGGANPFTFSLEVYVIRHGDGASYSKFQVTSMTGNGTSRVRVIKYANF